MNGWTPPKKKWSKGAWDQLRNITKKKILNLLDKDPRWTLVPSRGATITYHNPALPIPFDKVAIHPHSGKGYRRQSLLRDLLDQICWTEESLREMKVIKK